MSGSKPFDCDSVPKRIFEKVNLVRNFLPIFPMKFKKIVTLNGNPEGK